MSNTRPPASHPVDHARWAEERQRQLDTSISGEGTKIKLSHPIWDNRWAMLFGSSLWGVLVLLLVNLGSKVDTTTAQLMVQGVQLSQQSADTKVLDVKLEAMKAEFRTALQLQNERLQRVEARK